MELDRPPHHAPCQFCFTGIYVQTTALSSATHYDTTTHTQVVAAVLSSTIYLMGFLLQWVPLSVFVLTFGLLVLMPPSLKGWHIKAIPTSAASPQVTLTTQPAPTAVNKVLQSIDNVLARVCSLLFDIIPHFLMSFLKVPDNDEVVHRVIADGQICNEMSTRV